VAVKQGQRNSNDLAFQVSKSNDLESQACYEYSEYGKEPSAVSAGSRHPFGPDTS